MTDTSSDAYIANKPSIPTQTSDLTNDSGFVGGDVVADEYSTSSTYAVGDYCLYDGDLYRCTTAISTAEAWTAAHWTAVTVADELTDLKGDITHIQDHGITSEMIAQESFIAGGNNNKVITWAERDTNPQYSHVEGNSNDVYGWEGHGEGAGTITDGKVSHAEGNLSIASANDSHAEGNRTSVGRRLYVNVWGSGTLEKGSEDAGDSLGTLPYIIIPDLYGDVTSFFPNALTDNITTRYGTGAQKDTEGNIYANGLTPAVWDNGSVVTANDLQWALHPYMMLRPVAEVKAIFKKIAKSIYISGTGTKVYYYGEAYNSPLSGVYSSYSPTVTIDGVKLGNGIHSEGLFTSATGYASHAEGWLTCAWGENTHAEGMYSSAIGTSSHAEGYNTESKGKYSHAFGAGSIARRDYEHSTACALPNADKGKRQYSEVLTDNKYVNRGWHVIPLVKDYENNKTYFVEAEIMGRQIAGSAETIGNTFVYKYVGLISFDIDGVATFITPQSLTLVGRSSGMSGDGTTSGVRMELFTNFKAVEQSIFLKFESLANTTYQVMTHSKWLEMADV